MSKSTNLKQTTPSQPTPQAQPNPQAQAELGTATAIRSRRTVPLKHILPDPIDETTLWALLEAAHWAPNHGKNEPWRFAVFTGAGRDKLSQALAESLALHKETELTEEMLSNQREKQQGAPVWIVVCAKSPESSKIPEFEDDWATAAAVQNLLLAARAKGIGSKWISNPPSMHPHTLEALGFEKGCRPLGLLYLGYVSEWAEGKRGDLGEKVTWFRE